MASLSAHLTTNSAAHGRLRFHPDCPRCQRERLTGSLPADALAARRTQAALAAGVFALSAAAPPVGALAAPPPQDPAAVEQDRQEEGTEAPKQEAPGLDAGFDPGGEDDTFVDDTTPPPSDDDSAAETDDDTTAPAETAPPQEPPAATTPPPPPPAAAPPAPPPPPAPVPLVDPEQIKSDEPPERLTARADREPKAPSGRTYTVRAGDSLWSIARRQLGPEASTGQVARTVERLWQLNADRIATGNPDMLHIGTVLELP